MQDQLQILQSSVLNENLEPLIKKNFSMGCRYAAKNRGPSEQRASHITQVDAVKLALFSAKGWAEDLKAGRIRHSFSKCFHAWRLHPNQKASPHILAYS